MNELLKKRLMRTALLSLIALVIGIGVGFVQVFSDSAQVVQKGSTATAMPGVQIGGNFELVDHTGKTVTQDDYAGQYKLIYFGFTYCPAICPTELQKITETLNTLGTEADTIQPLFITIDPERDTVETMQQYVKMFHPRLIGLTGNRAQIDKALTDYRVFAKRVEDPEMNDYTMDHSSFIYLMSPENELISIYRIEDDAAFVVKDIREKIGKH